MVKKLLLTVTLFAVTSLLAGCGGGSGGSSGPSGVNPNAPSIVQLLPVQYIAQTNSFITFKAKILNGNGNVMPGVGVVFTKISLLGVLSSTYAVTDSLGFATVTISSTTSGFVTLQAEVNTGTGIVRDKRTVFFTSGDLNVQPYIVLDVDGDNDGIWNEPSDFNVFENPADTQVNIRATVFSGIGQPISGTSVVFGADAPYRTSPGGACSDGADNCPVTFLLGNISTTDSLGRAFTAIQANPVTLMNITTILNITAQESFFGAYNIASLFLNPVNVSSVVLYAAPTEIESGGTSTISAGVFTNLGTPVPDGTVVSFQIVSGGGSISPVFSQTTDGMTEGITYTAPVTTTDLTAIISGTTGGRSGSTTVRVTGTPADLAVSPAAPSIASVTGGTITFTATGGEGPYNATSNTLAKACNSTDADCADPADTAVWSSFTSTFTVTVPAGAAPGTVTITVNDAVGGSVTATITIL